MAVRAFPALSGRKGVLATMHAKEQVIAPTLQDGIGLIVDTIPDFDTDRFGTFSREIERAGSQLDAAKAKIAAALEARPDVEIAIASEGSFGPDPALPFVTLALEMVTLVDRRTGLELVGVDAGYDSNFAHCDAADLDAALSFAARIGFPGHGIVAMGIRNGEPAPKLDLVKNIEDGPQLERAVLDIIARCGAAHLETDMRAHRNPTRMKAIERAAQDLVRRFHQRCPECDFPGYGVVERIAGLPCEWCGTPTDCAQVERLACKRCGTEEKRPATDRPSADPGQCAICNP